MQNGSASSLRWTRNRFASAALSLSGVPLSRDGILDFLQIIQKKSQGNATGKLSISPDLPHHRNHHPPHLRKSLKRKGEVWRGEGELSPESSLPFPNLKFSPHSQSFSLKSVMRLALEKVRGSAPGSTISTLMRAMMRLCISSPMARAIPASLPEPTPD